MGFTNMKAIEKIAQLTPISYFSGMGSYDPEIQQILQSNRGRKTARQRQTECWRRQRQLVQNRQLPDYVLNQWRQTLSTGSAAPAVASAPSPATAPGNQSAHAAAPIKSTGAAPAAAAPQNVASASAAAPAGSTGAREALRRRSAAEAKAYAAYVRAHTPGVTTRHPDGSVTTSWSGYVPGSSTPEE